MSCIKDRRKIKVIPGGGLGYRFMVYNNADRINSSSLIEIRKRCRLIF